MAFSLSWHRLVPISCAASLIVLAACGGGGGSADNSVEPAAAVTVALTPSPPLADIADAAALAALAAAAGASAPAAEPAVTVLEAPLAAAATGLQVNAGALPSESWSAAATKVAAAPAWSGWVASRKASIDAWTSKPRERADLIGGYMHDYIDAATGLPLNWTPDSPEPPNGSTDAQLKFKQAWVFYLRDYNIRRLIDAARVFKVSGETKYRDWAAAQLDFYADNYGLWPLRTNNGRARMFQNGLDEATASFSLLDAARLLAPDVTAARAERWRSNLFYPMAGNLKSTGSPLTNIGLWHGAAVAAIGMRYRDAALVSWGLDSTIGVRATLAACLTADNLWNEGSFSYNSYVIAALTSLVTQAGLEGYASQVASEKATITRLLLSPLDFRFDDGMLPTPSDATPLAAIDVGTHFAAYRVASTWWGVQKAASYQSWDTLVDPPPALPAQPALPPVSTRNFASVRMAVLRAGPWQAFVHYGQATANHAQQETPGYELYKGTTRVSTDAGTVSYGSPYHSEYFTKGPGNNVPLVDGNGQAGWAPGTLDAFVAADNRITVTNPAYQPAVSVSRDFRLATQGLTESTTLTASDAKARRLGVVFQTGCSVTPLSGLAAATGMKPPANSATGYWSGLAAYTAQASWSVRLTCGGSSFTYSVTGPAAQTVFIGKGPATPLPATRPVLYYESTGTQAKFSATISG
ncbi:MAG: heparinase II/III family protein [Bacteroidia bacterium]|jgi:hypothetical protein